MNRIIGCLAALALGLAGCSLLKINVGGKQIGLPGASSEESTAAATKGSTPGAQPPDENRTVENVVVEGELTEIPRLVKVERVAMNGSARKVIGISPDCGSDTSPKPLATIELKQAMPSTFVISVAGGRDDGFVVVRDGLVWTTCTQTTSQIPTMGAPQEGWVPGKYSVYAIARSGGKKGVDFTIELYDPAKKAVWSDKVKKISIAKKLEKPMFVEVTTQPARVTMREHHAGRGCQVPMPTEPDVSLVLERPIPGLIVRPLYTKTPVALRVHEPATSKSEGRKFCPEYRRQVVANGYMPSFESRAEYHFRNEAEGAFGFSFGTAQAGEATKVMLMIFDSSTQWDRLAMVGAPGELPLDQRFLERYYPQLDTRELNQSKYENALMLTKLFATVPSELFVYSKLDLDHEIAKLDSSHIDPKAAYPRKNEPLLLVGLRDDHATVLTAEGARYSVKASHVLPSPDGAVSKPTVLRALKKDVRFGDLSNMSPPSAKTITASYDASYKQYQACATRAWGPYGKKLDGATWTVSHSDGSSTRVEAPAARKIREDGERAIDKACGTQESMDKKAEGNRMKLLAEVEKERAKLLVQAAARF